MAVTLASDTDNGFVTMEIDSTYEASFTVTIRLDDAPHDYQILHFKTAADRDEALATLVIGLGRDGYTVLD